MNQLVAVIVVLMCFEVPAFAMNPFRRCAVALTASLTKGPRQAAVAWRVLKEDNTAWTYHRPSAKTRRSSLVWRTDVLTRQLGREVTPQNVVAVARELVADEATSKAVLGDVIASLRYADLLGEGADFIARLRAHPNTGSEAKILSIASNTTSGLNPGEVAKLVMSILESRVGEDRYDGDVPSSAHPASYICELQNLGRLSMADFGRAYVFMIDNPRAKANAQYWILSFLHNWAKERYVLGGPLPPRDLSRTLIQKARARLDRFKYPRDILRERMDETERLLGL